jgi:hypothetical protein
MGTAAAVFLVTLTGCPVPLLYDQGFDDGFDRDDWYWSGFFDSYDTMDFDPLYYQGSDIPVINDESYDAGFNDGIWYAYNDGYYADYRYAFIVGFSEGYDAAYIKPYLSFLAGDVHIENLNGGWGDGYNDGFSEGRIFGAADYEDGRNFDWLDALLDYESGTDVFFNEINLGTGEFGPVDIYEYGVDPFTLKSTAANRAPRAKATPTIRGKGNFEDDDALFRPLTNEAIDVLHVLVIDIDRSDLAVSFTTTRLERIDAYLAAFGIAVKDEVKAPRPRAVKR